MSFYESAVRYGVILEILDILDMLPVLDFHIFPFHIYPIQRWIGVQWLCERDESVQGGNLPRRCDAQVAGTAEILSGPFWIIRYHTGVSCNLQSIVEVPSCESF